MGFPAGIILSGLGLKQKTRRPRFKTTFCYRKSLTKKDFASQNRWETPGSPIFKMAKEKFGSVRRFGARYGATIKRRLAKVESGQKKLHKCPYCNAIKVKRVSLGIWRCKKCKAKFTGKAYTTSSKKVLERSKEAGVENG